MEREPLLKFIRYVFYTVLGCGLVYVLIPMDLPELRSTIVQIVLQQLTVLIIVALFLERALEVYKLWYFSPEKERLAVEVEREQVELELLVADVENSSSEEAIGAVQLRLFNAEESLRVYKNHTRQALLRAAIVFGFLIGLVGVRSLENAFDFPAVETAVEGFRFYLFRMLDLILTAGLIAGGSEGIHGVVKKLSGFFPDMPKKAVELVQAFKE
ncbi:MAG: hypothetical protein KTR27_11715 [Leptolyngbyaceae cyanobacterium MAG.088]|nr:hypothetical protein [Leptolyngbyaceae cyanobacterium MAG.088]